MVGGGERGEGTEGGRRDEGERGEEEGIAGHAGSDECGEMGHYEGDVDGKLWKMCNIWGRLDVHMSEWSHAGSEHGFGKGGCG